MDKMKKIALSAGFIGVVIAVLWFLFSWNEWQNSSHTTPIKQNPALQTPLETHEEKELTAIDELRKDNQERKALKPDALFLSGRVTDKRTGQPVNAYHLELLRVDSSEDIKRKESMIIMNKRIDDEEGRFLVHVDEEGEYEIEILSSRYLDASVKGLLVNDKTGLAGIEIELDPGFGVTGCVKDDATGQAIQNAVIMAVVPDVLKFEFGYDSGEVKFFIEGDKEACIHAETDEKGFFDLRGFSNKEKRITAVHPDYAEGYVDIVPGETDMVEIRLKEGYCVFGKVYSDHGHPLQGILIQISGKEIPVDRYTKTGKEGTYRTTPALPDRVKVGAFAPPQEITVPLEKNQFEEETKIIRIIDRDVEVNFGVAEEYVTWKGTLSVDGLPLPFGGEVVVSIDDSYPWKEMSFEAGFRYEYCDKEGRFEVNKLLPGRYEVKIITLAEGGYESKEIYWGKVNFSKPGVVEKDIRLSLEESEISGQVVYGQDGEPVLGKTGIVEATRIASHHVRESLTTSFGQYGRFRFTGLSAGEYDLSVKRPFDRISSTRDAVAYVELPKNKKVTDVKVPFIEEGQLKLIVTGLKEPGFNELDVIFRLTEGFRTNGGFGNHLDEEGNFEKTVTLAEDSYLAIISHPGSRGVGQHDVFFQIFDGQETVISIGPSDLIYFDGEVLVSGTLRGSDDSAITGAKVDFSSEDVPSHEEYTELTIEAVVDGSGRFAVTGFKPGIWKVSAITADGSETIFPKLNIPIDTVGHVSLDLVLPTGTVSGVFRDSQTNRLLDDTGPDWKVYIYICGQGAASACAYGKGGPDFEVTGVSPGRYELRADVTGYQWYDSDPFELKEDQILNLGEVKLVPCGTLDLEILDKNQVPVKKFKLFCNDEEMAQYFGQKLGPGCLRFDKLPLGSMEIKVVVPGHPVQSKTIELEPAKAVKARVILD